MIHALLWESYRWTLSTHRFLSTPTPPFLHTIVIVIWILLLVFPMTSGPCGETTDPSWSPCPNFTRWQVLWSHREELRGQRQAPAPRGQIPSSRFSWGKGTRSLFVSLPLKRADWATSSHSPFSSKLALPPGQFNYLPYLSVTSQRPQIKRNTTLFFPFWVISMLILNFRYSLSLLIFYLCAISICGCSLLG